MKRAVASLDIMAASVINKLTPSSCRLGSQLVLTTEIILNQPLKICKHNVFIFGRNEILRNVHTKAIEVFSPKRKLLRTAITVFRDVQLGFLFRRRGMAFATHIHQEQPPNPRKSVETVVSPCNKCRSCVSVSPSNSFRHPKILMDGSLKNKFNNMPFFNTLMPMHTSSSHFVQQVQSARHYSSKRHSERRRSGKGSGKDGKDEKDVEQEFKNEQVMMELKGKVIYVPNPVKWATNKMNLVKLSHNIDKNFNEEEFVNGAQQAITFVLQKVSEGDFMQLKGLVLDEVIEYLTNYRSTLSDHETAALFVKFDEIVLLKIQDVLISEDIKMTEEAEENNTFVYIDTVCFGLKLCDNVPYLVDIGVRFARDYHPDSLSGWMVSGLTHIRVLNLADPRDRG